MNDIVSIIVPVYNVEKYVKKCIDSIVAQTYKSLEIILVNDGSTDTSGDICTQQAKLDNRIKAMNKQNGGLSDARNFGIDKATGKYLCFVDSDDTLHPQMIEIMLNAMIATDKNISVCDFLEVTDDFTPTNATIKNIKYSIYDMEQTLGNLYNDMYVKTVIACCKIYDAKLFTTIRFPYKKLHEDEYTTYKILMQSNGSVYIDSALYYYLQRADSITGEGFKLSRIDGLGAFEERAECFKDNNLMELYSKAAYNNLMVIAKYYYSTKKYFPNKKDVINSLKNRYKTYYKKYNSDIIISFSKRIIIALLNINLAIYIPLQFIKGKL